MLVDSERSRVGAQMTHGGEIAALRGQEDVLAIAAVDLRGAFEEEALGRREGCG